MKCAKCGYERQSRDDAFVPISECPACGVVYAKHDAAKDPAETPNPVRPPHLKPSPVDALSLRKARERVEKRLRERQGGRVKDERHAQTLKLAKRLTTEQIRKRQGEWSQSRSDEQAGQLPPDSSSTADPGQDIRPNDTHKLPNLESVGAMEMETKRASQAEDGKMTSAGHSSSETVDSSTLAEAVPPGPDDQGAPASTDTIRGDKMALLRQEVAAECSEIPRTTGQPKIFCALAATQQGADGTPAESEPPLTADPLAAAVAQRQSDARGGKGLARLLPVVAWLILCAGVIGAVLSWATISDVEAGVRIPMSEGMNGLPLGLLLGFAYLATGVLGFAFFWVSSLISNQLRDIRRLLIVDEIPE